jgi:hypothetical protein
VSRIYLMGEDGSTKELERISCTDEDKELQRLLEKNLDLLPGDQISPGDRLRWLMVKREMPVVNPSSGGYAWAIDFLLVDQDAMPTFVECKRRNDPRSRREVVGQILEYAANGRYYWSGSEFRSHAQNTAGSEAALDQKLKDLTGDPEVEAEEFFSAMEKNLQQSKIRLIFLLEDSPYELRSIVEFLNGQLRDMEVLIVEARQYQHGERRIVVPSVFGFTEEARVAKRESRREIERSSLAKGESAFWESITGGALTDAAKNGIREFVNNAASISGCEVTYLRTCMISVPRLLPQRQLFGIQRSGYLDIYLASWRPREGTTLTDQQTAARDMFVSKLKDILGVDQEKQYPSVASDKWIPHSGELFALLGELTKLTSPERELVSPSA